MWGNAPGLPDFPAYSQKKQISLLRRIYERARRKKAQELFRHSQSESQQKGNNCIADYDKQAIESDKSRKTLRKNLLQRLRVFPFSSVEQTINPLYPQRYYQLSQMDCIAYRYELSKRAKTVGRDDTGAVCRTPAHDRGVCRWDSL